MIGSSSSSGSRNSRRCCIRRTNRKKILVPLPRLIVVNERRSLLRVSTLLLLLPNMVSIDRQSTSVRGDGDYQKWWLDRNHQVSPNRCSLRERESTVTMVVTYIVVESSEYLVVCCVILSL